MLAMPSHTGHKVESWNGSAEVAMDDAAACLALDKLTELAIIATGPQSPLLQLPSHKESTTTG